MDEQLRHFYDLFLRRKSVRAYTDEEVDDETLHRILDVGRRAPSAANYQPWDFVILRREDNEAFFEQIHREGYWNAPVVLVACAKPERAWQRSFDKANFAWVDVAIAVTDMIAAATAEGLGTCWVAAIDPAKVKKLLEMPENIDVVATIALGHPATPLVKEEKQRRSMEEVFHEGRLEA